MKPISLATRTAGVAPALVAVSTGSGILSCPADWIGPGACTASLPSREKGVWGEVYA